MKRETKRNLLCGGVLLAAFALWTVALRVVDVQPIGPQDSKVGFGAVNGFVHSLTGVHMTLYTITDWLGLVSVAVGLGFAVLGLTQWIREKQLARVDRSLLVLGGFYAVVMAAYLFFEQVVINYRPVLIGGVLEASYPSSTTMLVMCVMPTAAMELRQRIKNRIYRRFVCGMIYGFAAFMVIGRLLSGVHWLSDIVGGLLLSTGLVTVYKAACQAVEK